MRSCVENVRYRYKVVHQPTSLGWLGGYGTMLAKSIAESTSVGSFNTRKHTLKASSGLIKNIFFIEARGSYVVSDGYVDRASSNLWSYFHCRQVSWKIKPYSALCISTGMRKHIRRGMVYFDFSSTNRRFNIFRH
jgi:hypothetical protein